MIEDKIYLKTQYFPNQILIQDSSISNSNPLNFLNDHIIVIGYNQTFLTFINYLQLQFKDNYICLLTNTIENDDAIFKKLLKKYKHFFCLKGDYLRISHLVTANVKQAKYIIINTGDYELNDVPQDESTIKNEVYKASTIFKVIDSNYNVPVLMLLNNHKYAERII